MEATPSISRRPALNSSAGAVLGSSFTIVRPELVRGARKERLKAGLVGCGRRPGPVPRAAISSRSALPGILRRFRRPAALHNFPRLSVPRQEKESVRARYGNGDFG